MSSWCTEGPNSGANLCPVTVRVRLFGIANISAYCQHFIACMRAKLSKCIEHRHVRVRYHKSCASSRGACTSVRIDAAICTHAFDTQTTGTRRQTHKYADADVQKQHNATQTWRGTRSSIVSALTVRDDLTPLHMPSVRLSARVPCLASIAQKAKGGGDRESVGPDARK